MLIVVIKYLYARIDVEKDLLRKIFYFYSLQKYLNDKESLVIEANPVKQELSRQSMYKVLNRVSRAYNSADYISPTQSLAFSSIF